MENGEKKITMKNYECLEIVYNEKLLIEKKKTLSIAELW